MIRGGDGTRKLQICAGACGFAISAGSTGMLRAELWAEVVWSSEVGATVRILSRCEARIKEKQQE